MKVRSSSESPCWCCCPLKENAVESPDKATGGGNSVGAANCFLNWRSGSVAPSAAVTTLQCL